MKGYFRLRLVFGIWSIIYFDDNKIQTGIEQFDDYAQALAYSKLITDYKDMDKSDLPVGNGTTKSGNLA
jgi:hypothetical protein